MTSLAITVVGHDRPGIIATAAAALSEVGMNLEDSSMTLLRGHFTMTLICAGAAEVTVVESALAPLADTGLTVSVREVAGVAEQPRPGESYLVTVHGADRLGIVAWLTATIAGAGGNITDLTTRLAGELYVLLAEVDLAPGADAAAFRTQVTGVAAEIGVDAGVRLLERDEL